MRAKHRVQERIVDHLLDSSIVAGEAGFQLLCELVDHSLGGRLSIRKHLASRPQMVEVVVACGRIAGGLRALLEVAMFLDKGIFAYESPQLLLDEWAAVEFRAVSDDQPRGWLPSSLGASRPVSTRPSVWGDVPPRNPNFTGRGALLSLLHERLGVGPAAVLPEALHGMGGVGKTQLAVEYVYRHQADYGLVWWIPAERPAEIGRTMTELAQRLLQLPVDIQTGAAVAAVREALRSGSPVADWLLVFDNAESPEEVRPFFPHGGPGCILVTSRNPGWSSMARPLEVDVFTRAESVALLQRRNPELSENDADRLAVALGDLPLAVEQAAAWRSETGMPADEYLDLLHMSRPELLEEARPHDYPTTVAAAWNVSLDALSERNPGALRLLQLCAVLAPEPIPKTLLTGAPPAGLNAELVATLRDPIEFSRAIREINRYALARVDHHDQSIQVHRLVQRVLIGQMSEEQRLITVHSAHLLLAAADPGNPDDAATWQRYGALYAHIVATGSTACDDRLVRRLVLNEGKYLWRRGDPQQACDLAEQEYLTCQQRLDADNTDMLRIAKWFGFMLFTVGRYAEAAALNSRTLQVCNRTLGGDRYETLEALQAVAADRRVQGKFHTALEISDDIYSRTQRLFGADGLGMLSAAHNLGVSLRLAGEYARAREIDEVTWRHLTQTLGEDHPDTLHTRLGLIIDQRELGEYAEAREALEALVARRRQLLGDNDFVLLRALHALTVTRRKAGDHAAALELSIDVERRFTERLGPTNPETMAAALNLSVDLRHNGDLQAALYLGTLTHNRYLNAYGGQHPHTVAAQVNAAATLHLTGNIKGSYDIDAEGHRTLVGSLGDNHVLTLSCAINVANDYFALGDLQRAYDRDLDTYERLRDLMGTSHPVTLACAANQAMDLRALDRDDESRRIHEETVDRLTDALGAHHPVTREATEWRRAHCDMCPMPL